MVSPYLLGNYYIITCSVYVGIDLVCQSVYALFLLLLNEVLIHGTSDIQATSSMQNKVTNPLL